MSNLGLGTALDAQKKMLEEIARCQRIMENDEKMDVRGYDRTLGKIKGLRFALEAMTPNQEEA